MSKGIAIQTILLLLVGILVVGILVYLVYSFTSKSALSKYDCQAKVINWCTSCMIKGWQTPCTVNGADPTKCECLGIGTNHYTKWVQFCVDSTNRWNFDSSATYSNYDGNPKTYCSRVGVGE